MKETISLKNSSIFDLLWNITIFSSSIYPIDDSLPGVYLISFLIFLSISVSDSSNYVI